MYGLNELVHAPLTGDALHVGWVVNVAGLAGHLRRRRGLAVPQGHGPGLTSLDAVSREAVEPSDAELHAGTWAVPRDEDSARHLVGHRGRGSSRGRRWGWLFALIWLFFLGNPLGAIHDHRAGCRPDARYAACSAFAVVLRRGACLGARPCGTPGGSRRRWPIAGVPSACCSVLGLLTVPAAGPHGLATMVYVSATAMMLLPLRWAWTLVAVLMVGVERSAFIFDGGAARPPATAWAIMLAALAVSGMRLACDRNSAAARWPATRSPGSPCRPSASGWPATCTTSSATRSP